MSTVFVFEESESANVCGDVMICASIRRNRFAVETFSLVVTQGSRSGNRGLEVATASR